MSASRNSYHEGDYLSGNQYLINGSFPRTKGRGRDYSTFCDNDEFSEEFRTRSVSVPYIACNSRACKRSLSTYDVHGNSNERNENQENGIKITNGNAVDANTKVVEDEEDENTPLSSRCFCGFSKRQVKCGIALILLSFTDVMGYSVFAPFFPIVAEEKGMSPVQIGIIFAAFSMAGIFASFLTGTLLVRIGAKFIIVGGMFWSAGATVCFGLLKMVYPQYFFPLCFVCRVLMGIGSSSAFTALFAVIFQEFKDRSMTVIGISESICSIGGILGPVIGGALYDVGGYKLPFFFLGGAELTIILLCIYTIPPVGVQRQENTISPARLLLNLRALFAALFVVLSFTVNSFIVANLSQFLIHSFDITAFMVGVFMLVFSIFYGISTPIWGYITDSKNCGAHMMAGTSLVSGVVLAFFGPADVVRNWIGWSGPEQWLVYVTTGILGTCMGGLVMPTFGEMVVGAKELKLHTNQLAEFGLVSGLWNTMFSIGDILGPTLGGVLVEKYNFENTCAIFGGTLVVMAIAKIVHLVLLWCRGKEQEASDSEGSEDGDETTSLLNKEQPSLQV